jgi:hypothetical protein
MRLQKRISLGGRRNIDACLKYSTLQPRELRVVHDDLQQRGQLRKAVPQHGDGVPAAHYPTGIPSGFLAGATGAIRKDRRNAHPSASSFADMSVFVCT